MYWQQRFDRQNPDAELEAKIKAIRQNNKDFGYRRIWGKLRKEGLLVNRKKVQRLVQKLGLQVKAFSHKSRKYSSVITQLGAGSCQSFVQGSVELIVISDRLTCGFHFR